MKLEVKNNLMICTPLLKAGVIQPSNSAWASPVCLVKKKDQSFRFCIDYRKLNAVSHKDAYPLPDIRQVFDSLKGAKYFISLDLQSGYWQVANTERAKERSAFCCKRGLFEFTRMPFGLCGAPASFSRCMQLILRNELWKICMCYLDDIIIFGATTAELLQRFRIVLDRLRDAGMKLKPNKCCLFQTQLQYLGHKVSAEGIEPLADKVDAVQNFPVPQCLRDVRAFYGLASYYRRFVKDFAKLAEPLSSLTRKQTEKFKWTPAAQKAFDALKDALSTVPILAFPEPGVPCILDMDASDVAVGAVLSQVTDGIERPIAFFSKVLGKSQQQYCATRREHLAVVMALQHFRHYLLGVKVILRTDHASLNWLNSFKSAEGMLARWLEVLQEFDLQVEHRPGRQHSNVDGMSQPFCKQCWGKSAKNHWVDAAVEGDELHRADELSELLWLTHDTPDKTTATENDVDIPFVNRVTFLPELSDDDMIELQSEDLELEPVIEWLRTGRDPAYDELRSFPLTTRRLWNLVPMIHLLDGILVFKPDTSADIKLVVPYGLRKQLFDAHHSGPLAAHLGSFRMLHELKRSYFWPGMRRDVESWCRECETCARGKGPPSHHHGTLQKVTTGAPLDIVAIDILSGLPTTKDGNKYILVITDYFTKWSEAYALPDAEASTCIRAIYDNFCARFGLPRQLHSDLGANFESKLFKELCLLVGTDKSHTSGFRAQSDGQAERTTRSLLQMLKATANDRPEDWPQRLPTLMAAYRMTVHKTIGMTPNMAMFGREVILPASLIARPPEEQLGPKIPFVQNFRDTLRDAHRRVQEATNSMARTQKLYYDKRSHKLHFKQGQLVWLYWPKPPVRQKYKKLSQLWTGPWRIEYFKSAVVCQIISTSGRKVRQTVNVDRLAPCSSPDKVPDSSETLHTNTADTKQQPILPSVDTESQPLDSDEYSQDCTVDPEIDRVEQNDRSTAICARLDDQLDFRRIFRLGSTRLNSCQL